MPPVKAYLTGSALLSSDTPPGSVPTTTGGSLGTTVNSQKIGKNTVPLLRTAVSIVKPSALPKPSPVVQSAVPKGKIPMLMSTPTSPMNAYFTPPDLLSAFTLSNNRDGSNSGSGGGLGVGSRSNRNSVRGQQGRSSQIGLDRWHLPCCSNEKNIKSEVSIE